MNQPLALAFLAGGILLLLFGINEMNSLNSTIVKFFSGEPSDKSLWMTIGGAMMIVVGAAGLSLVSRRT